MRLPVTSPLTCGPVTESIGLDDACLRRWWENPWGFESPLRHHRKTQREFGLGPSSLFLCGLPSTEHSITSSASAPMGLYPGESVKPFLIRAAGGTKYRFGTSDSPGSPFFVRCPWQQKGTARSGSLGGCRTQAAAAETLKRHRVMASFLATATIAFCGRPVRPRMRR